MQRSDWQGYTLPTAAIISAVVGTVLSSVNQGSVILSGDFSTETWLRVITNFAVPFIAASIGYLVPYRKSRNVGQ